MKPHILPLLVGTGVGFKLVRLDLCGYNVLNLITFTLDGVRGRNLQLFLFINEKHCVQALDLHILLFLGWSSLPINNLI